MQKRIWWTQFKITLWNKFASITRMQRCFKKSFRCVKSQLFGDHDLPEIVQLFLDLLHQQKWIFQETFLLINQWFHQKYAMWHHPVGKTCHPNPFLSTGATKNPLSSFNIFHFTVTAVSTSFWKNKAWWCHLINHMLVHVPV